MPVVQRVELEPRWQAMYEHQTDTQAGSDQSKPEIIIRQMKAVYVNEVKKKMSRSTKQSNDYSIVVGRKSSFLEIFL
jgi:hypothetical protein